MTEHGTRPSADTGERVNELITERMSVKGSVFPFLAPQSTLSNKILPIRSVGSEVRLYGFKS